MWSTPRRKGQDPGKTPTTQRMCQWVWHCGPRPEPSQGRSFLRIKELSIRGQNPKCPTSAHSIVQDHASNSALEKGSEGVLQAPEISMHSTGRGHRIALEEIGRQTGSDSITRKNKYLFCRHPSPSHPFII